MREKKDRRLGFSKKDRKRIWKNHMEEIMNKEKDWNQITAIGMVKRPIKNVIHKKNVDSNKSDETRKGSLDLLEYVQR